MGLNASGFITLDYLHRPGSFWYVRLGNIVLMSNAMWSKIVNIKKKTIMIIRQKSRRKNMNSKQRRWVKKE